MDLAILGFVLPQQSTVLYRQDPVVREDVDTPVPCLYGRLPRDPLVVPFDVQPPQLLPGRRHPHQDLIVRTLPKDAKAALGVRAPVVHLLEGDLEPSDLFGPFDIHAYDGIVDRDKQKSYLWDRQGPKLGGALEVLPPDPEAFGVRSPSNNDGRDDLLVVWRKGAADIVILPGPEQCHIELPVGGDREGPSLQYELVVQVHGLQIGAPVLVIRQVSCDRNGGPRMLVAPEKLLAVFVVDAEGRQGARHKISFPYEDLREEIGPLHVQRGGPDHFGQAFYRDLQGAVAPGASVDHWIGRLLGHCGT